MSTFRIQARLSSAIRQLSHLRAQLESEQATPLVKLVVRCQTIYLSLRIGQLIQQLHAHPSTRSSRL